MKNEDLNLNDTPAPEMLGRLQGDAAKIKPDDIRAAQSILRVSKRLLADFSSPFQAHGLSPGRYSVLMELHAQPAPVGPSELAKKIGITRASMTGLTTGLMNDGLIEEVESDDADRRRKAFNLTHAGRERIQTILPGILTRMSELVTPFNPDELEVLLSLLSRVEEVLDPVHKQGDKK